MVSSKNVLPSAGFDVKVTGGEQSVKAGRVQVGIALHWGSALTLIGDMGAASTGLLVSTTTTLNSHLLVLLLLFLAVYTTLVVPMGKFAPGAWVDVRTASHWSTVGTSQDTFAEHAAVEDT